LRRPAARAIIRAMTERSLVLHGIVASMVASLSVVGAAAQTAPAANRGSFRFEGPAKLAVTSACAIGMKNGDVLVVMTDAPINCAAAAKAADPMDAVLNSREVVKARVHFTVKAKGTLSAVFLANVAGASTYSDDANGVLKPGPKSATTIAGAVSSGGVKKIQLYQGPSDMEYDVTFNTPIIKAAK
jgi:hypothetical protein